MLSFSTKFTLRLLVAALVLLLVGCADTGQIASNSTYSTRSADGFDFPVNPPEAQGFTKSRGFRAGGHLGEDWITDGGSSKGFGLPVWSIANGVVVIARDVHVGWGNVVVIRHAWIEHRQLNYADSLYAHLDKIRVREGQQVLRGQQIGNIGTNHGMYPPHLHFEMHKDLSIGVNHAQGTRDLRSYWIPTDFINSHRRVGGGGPSVPIPQPHFLLPTAANPWSFPNFFHHHASHHLHHLHHAKSHEDQSQESPSPHHSHTRHHHSKTHHKKSDSNSSSG